MRVLDPGIIGIGKKDEKDRVKTISSKATSMRKTISALLATLSGTVALAALPSWFMGRWEWLSLGTGGVPMAPATAILLIFLSAILLAEIFAPENTALRRSCRVGAVLITLAGLAALLRPFWGWSSPLEQWIAGTTQVVDNAPVGQMSPLTGLVFLLISSASWVKALHFLDKKWLRRLEFGLSGLVFWISAAVILGYVAGTPLFSDRPIIPMALLTAIIFFFLSFALALRYEPAESSEVSMTSEGKKLFVHRPFWILVSSLVAFAVLAGGIVYLRREETRIREIKSEELTIIGKTKTDQILRWRKERIADIVRFSEAPFLRKAVEAWFHKPDEAVFKGEIIQRLKIETQTGIYTQALLMDANAHVLASFPETAEVADEIRNVIKGAWDRPGPVISELHPEVSGAINADIIATIRDVSHRPLATVVFTTDAREYLFPMIRTWPAHSHTGEVLLVRRDGSDVLYLNDLNHRENTALALRLPLTRIQEPAVQAVLGKTGPVIGTDYRGTEVFADLRPVPGTPWYLVTKVDVAEILTEVRFRAVTVFAMASILTASILGSIVLLYQTRFIKQRAEAEERLRASKQKLDLALKAARMGVWELNFVKNKRIFDHQTCFLLGIEPETFGGTAEEFYAKVHPEDREKIKEALTRTINGQAVYEPEYRVLWPDGSVHYISGRGEVRRDDQGKPLAIEGLIWDITERKRADEALRQAEERYRELVEETDDLITVVDKQGRFIFVNHSTEKIFGIKPEDCIGRPAFDFIHPDDLERTRKAFEGWVARKEKQINFQNRQVHKSGLVFDVLWNIHLHFDESGEVEDVCSFARDITEQKKAEERLRESEESIRKKLGSILSSQESIGDLELGDIIDVDVIQAMMEDFYKLTRVPVAIIDVKGKVLVKTGWQDICTKFHRIHSETLKKCIECDTVLTQDIASGTFKSYLCKNNLWDNATPLIIGGKHMGNLFTGQFFYEGEKPDDAVFRAQAAQYGFDEKEYMAALRRVPVWKREDIQSAMVFYTKLANVISSLSFANVGLAKKIEENRRSAEEIKTLNRELEERVRQRTAELSNAVKELEAFGYSIAHDLKAPLRVMSGFANILSEDYASKLDENAKRVIGVINDNAKSMGTMIDDLLELTRVGRQQMSIADIDMTTIVRSSWSLLERKVPSGKNLELSVKSLPSARADQIFAKQIFINLIANALKFTRFKEKAVIEIGSYDKDGERVYYVKDNGAGFDMKYKDKLFGIFQRLHSQEQFEGTGIGLAIVKAAVLRHGGRVWAEGEVGQGATFYFTLSGGAGPT